MIRPTSAKRPSLTTWPEGRRILHIVGSMNPGGVETWLMHVLRQINRQHYHMNFLVHYPQPGIYDAEIRSLGSQILLCPQHKHPWQYARNFAEVLRRTGPYDVIHSHVHHYSGYILLLARLLGIPMRIAHSHYGSTGIDHQTCLRRRMYIHAMAHTLPHVMTQGLAASKQAALALFGARWRADQRIQLLYYGIDPAPYWAPREANRARAALRIPPDALVVGHVGRFSPEKNHAFLLAIARELCQLHPQIYLVLVGDGPLRSTIEAAAAQQGLRERVIFTGVRQDVAGLMCTVMDAFVLPSRYEGLGLVAIEAQAAGLPCILAEGLPDEVDICPDLIQRLSLSAPARNWADAILQAIDAADRNAAHLYLQAVEQSIFNIHTNIQRLEDLYRG